MGPYRNNIQETFTGVAGADLTNMGGRFIKRGADGRYVLCDTSGERADGVLIKGRKENESINFVAYPGGVGNLKCVPAGLANNTALATDNVGRAKVAAVNDIVLAISREAAAAVADGDTINANLVIYQRSN